MGLAKKAEAAVAEAPVAETPKAESGTDVALARLKTVNKPAETKAAYKQRDFDAEARGKTRCVMFAAALQSNAPVGMPFTTMEEYLKLVKQAADAGVAYSFQE